jgi:glycosyltransferase involved in cell wall biosynthesis
MKKKILIWGYHPSSPTGLGYVTGLLMSTLIKIGHNVTVLAYQGGDLNLPQINGIFNYDKQHLERYIKTIQDSDTDIIISIGDLWACEPVWEMVAKTAVTWIAYTSCEGLSYPTMVRISSKEVLNMDKAVELISCIWAYDKRSSEVFKQRFNIDTQILPHAIDYKSVKEAPRFELKKSLCLESSDKLALIIADNIVRKGLDLFVEWLMLEHNNDWYGYIHAPEFRDTGIDLEELREIYKNKLNGRLFLRKDLVKATHRDFLTKEELYGMYKDCDLYLHPHRAEGFGLTVLEAIVAGANVRATDIAGPASFVPKSNRLPIKKFIYMQHGGVGYIGAEPNIADINPIPIYVDPPKGFDLSDFINNLEKLMSCEYKPKIWRGI